MQNTERTCHSTDAISFHLDILGKTGCFLLNWLYTFTIRNAADVHLINRSMQNTTYNKHCVCTKYNIGMMRVNKRPSARAKCFSIPCIKILNAQYSVLKRFRPLKGFHWAHWFHVKWSEKKASSVLQEWLFVVVGRRQEERCTENREAGEESEAGSGSLPVHGCWWSFCHLIHLSSIYRGVLLVMQVEGARSPALQTIISIGCHDCWL